MGGSSGGGDAEITTRYADYVEDKHQAFLNEIVTRRNAAIDNSPYTGVTTIASDDGFFGVGYTLASFPSLYDMYGKFMAGLDIDVLISQGVQAVMTGPYTNDLVSAEAQLLEDDLQQNALPTFETGMRDLNAVMSSSFVMGRALLESDRQKMVTKFSAELKYRLIPVAVDWWKTHLDWNKAVVMTYAEIMKLYFSAKMDIDNQNTEMLAKNRLWPFTVLDYEGVAIATLQGATKQTTATAGSSGAERAISGALGGAAAGGMTRCHSSCQDGCAVLIADLDAGSAAPCSPDEVRWAAPHNRAGLSSERWGTYRSSRSI